MIQISIFLQNSVMLLNVVLVDLFFLPAQSTRLENALGRIPRYMSLDCGRKPANIG